MEELYATLIIHGKKNFSQVPKVIKDKVGEVLKQRKERGEISEETYQDLISK